MVADFQYAELHVAAYIENEDWIDFIIAQDNESLTFARGIEVRTMSPRLGPVTELLNVSPC